MALLVGARPTNLRFAPKASLRFSRVSCENPVNLVTADVSFSFVAEATAAIEETGESTAVFSVFTSSRTFCGTAGLLLLVVGSARLGSSMTFDAAATSGLFTNGSRISAATVSLTSYLKPFECVLGEGGNGSGSSFSVKTDARDFRRLGTRTSGLLSVSDSSTLAVIPSKGATASACGVTDAGCSLVSETATSSPEFVSSKSSSEHSVTLRDKISK